MPEELKHGRPMFGVTLAGGGEDGWRRQHALASMRACLGVLTFAAAGHLALDDMEALQAVIGGLPGHLRAYLGWYRALDAHR